MYTVHTHFMNDYIREGSHEENVKYYKYEQNRKCFERCTRSRAPKCVRAKRNYNTAENLNWFRTRASRHYLFHFYIEFDLYYCSGEPQIFVWPTGFSSSTPASFLIFFPLPISPPLYLSVLVVGRLRRKILCCVSLRLIVPECTSVKDEYSIGC